jgi:hypothetical protein
MKFVRGAMRGSSSIASRRHDAWVRAQIERHFERFFGFLITGVYPRKIPVL